ncbi:MAG: hypothetical protein PHQ36_08650 [Anaerolineales bacterium]|nr:hypothetical protein [Anaerolineales bacterium]
MQAPVNHIIGFANIVRERLLPVKGDTLVRLNQRVSSGDIVAEARFAREHVLLDVSRILRVHPKTAERLITCKMGDRLSAGAEIAVGQGLFPRSVAVPRDGIVAAIGGGQVLVEVGEAKIEMRAGIPGTVVEIIPDRGVAIQTTGALIQGAWGNGRIDAGLLVNLAESPDGVLTAARLDVSMRGAVILGGMVKDAETLKAAAELPVRGLILSSIYPSLLPTAREMRYPIMAIEGFGALPMNSAAYKLLSTNVKREVTVNAEAYDRYAGSRPEVIIALPTSSEAPTLKATETFAPGLQVRMRRPPAMGMIGSITAVKPGLTSLPSGLRAPAAEVKLENGETVVAPLVNLEVVG